MGAMSRDLASVVMLTKAVLENFPWQSDINVIEIPWREEVLQSVRNRSCGRNERNGRLVFGIMGCDKTVTPHPPVQRAIRIVREALLARGYEVCSCFYVFEWS